MPSTKPSDVGLPDWAIEIYKAVDENNIDRFMSFLTPNIGFGFDGKVMVRGHQEVRAFVDEYLSGFDSLTHYFEESITQGDTTFVRGRVDYKIADKDIVNVGWTVCFHLDDGLIDEYLIYMDSLPLLKLQGHISQ